MPDDPLIAALYLHRVLTHFDLQAAIAYRQGEIRDLQAEIRALTALAEVFSVNLDIRDERDPPIEASELARY